MSSTTSFYANMNSENDATRVASIVKRMAANRTPDYPTEIERFVAGIEIDGNTLKIENSYSLMCCTFCEWIPQIMMEIAMWDFGAFTMEAWHESESCGYEAQCNGRVFKNGKFRMSFYQHE